MSDKLCDGIGIFISFLMEIFIFGNSANAFDIIDFCLAGICDSFIFHPSEKKMASCFSPFKNVCTSSVNEMAVSLT